MTAGLTLREASPADAAAIAAIYGYWVLNGTGTFEETVPSPDEMAGRMAAVAKSGMPWLVACDAQGAIKGYAYASPFRPRTGYRWSVEDSVYVAPDLHGRGLGGTMLKALIARVEATGVRQMLAVIGDSENRGSIALHRACGFQDAGVFKDVGYKFERWLDIVLMQLTLNGGATTPPERGTGWRG
jgi:L-amino acid N-acyltransferase YncA